MKYASWWLWTLSAVLVIACLAVPFMPITALPFDTHLVAGGNDAIKPSSLGIPLPANLKSGDVIRYDQMDVTSRISLTTNDDPPGTPIRLIVERAGQLLHVTAQVTQPRSTFKNLLLVWALIALIWLEVALGLLILWRGRHKAAVGIAIWCLTDAITKLVSSIPMPSPVGDYVEFVAFIFLQTPLQLYGLFLVAAGLTAEMSRNWRRWMVRTFFSLLVLYVFAVLVTQFFITAIGNDLLGERMFNGVAILHIACFALPIAMLLLAYHSVSIATRLRIRWIFLSLLMLVLSYLVFMIPKFSINLPLLISVWLQIIFTGAALCGFTYAVLRHQLVPVRWVVNRTLVYAIVTSLVVSLFALVLSFMQHSALGTGTNRIVALVIALLLGMGLNAVKRQLDHYLNQLFFRHERRERSAFNKLIHVAGDITDREVLLDRAADELFSQSRARGLSLYLAEGEGHDMKRVRERGDLGTPDRIDAHDPGLLQLKAGDKWIDLQSVKSKLGSEGHVFPMRVGQQLIGLVVCGPRLAGQRISDELKLLASVTLRIAALLYTLETNAQHDLLIRVAKGGSRIPKGIRTRAQVLVGTRATGR